MGELVILERVGPVAVLTLNRAERHNSLVPEFLAEMLAALETFGAQPGVRAVVLQANGRSFSTGGDLRGFYEHLDDLEAYAGEIVGLLNRRDPGDDRAAGPHCRGSARHGHRRLDGPGAGF